MKSKDEILDRIKTIEDDDRYQSGLKHPVNVLINAPLALIQVSLETETKTLKCILEDTETK